LWEGANCDAKEKIIHHHEVRLTKKSAEIGGVPDMGS